MIRQSLLAAVTLGVFAGAAPAAPVFFDNFAAEPAALAVTSLTNFSVAGNVDVVLPVNPYGISTPGGTVIDLDGTTGPGALTSVSSFLFNAGDTVVLSLLLGGSQRLFGVDLASGGFTFGGPTTVSGITGTGLFSGTTPGGTLSGISYSATLPSNTPFTPSTIGFTAVTAGSLTIQISTTSGDNVGPLLASVQLDVTPVPVPGALALFGLGLLGLGVARRRA